MKSRYWSSSIILLWLGVAISAQAEPAQCTYSTYDWNVQQRKAVNVHTVRHRYSDITRAERDYATGCTLCEEDQVWIELPGVARFRLCRRVAPRIVPLLEQMQADGFPFFEIEGYRVGKTRGVVDERGNRTGFSNHSFGVAIDINPQQNGLYDHCRRFGPLCRLIRGGAWHYGQAGSLFADHPLVLSFKSIGYNWGGEIAGKQKDFMHFSPSGY